MLNSVSIVEMLTHLSRVRVHFHFNGCWTIFSSFHSNLNRAFFKQTLEILIKHRILVRLIYICKVCQSPTERMPGLICICILNKLCLICLVMVERLFLAVPWGCLRYVIVVFPDHTHLIFFYIVCGLRLISRLIICIYFLHTG